MELGCQPRHRNSNRWVHRPRRRRPLVARRRRPGHCDTGGDPADTQGGEVALEEGRKEAGRRRCQWHHRHRRGASTVPTLRPRGGGLRRDGEWTPACPHARGRHAGREVPAVRAAACAVALSPEGRLPLRHVVQCRNVDPALLYTFHEQDGRLRKWHRG